jgi:hypothetical protein
VDECKPLTHGCSYDLKTLSLASLARLCATLEAAQCGGGSGGGSGGGRSGSGSGGLIEGFTLSQPTLQQVLLNLQQGSGS